jgi:hypothetical protein
MISFDRPIIEPVFTGLKPPGASINKFTLYCSSSANAASEFTLTHAEGKANKGECWLDITRHRDLSRESCAAWPRYAALRIKAALGYNPPARISCLAIGGLGGRPTAKSVWPDGGDLLQCDLERVRLGEEIDGLVVLTQEGHQERYRRSSSVAKRARNMELS